MIDSQASKAKKPPKASPWNSLEITKIVIGAMTPVSIAVLGIAVGAANSEQARLSRALDRRLVIWNTVGPQVRQMRYQASLIYRNSAPRLPKNQIVETIGAKGVLDRIENVDEMLEVRPFFSPSVMQLYLDFSTCALELTQSIEFNALPGAQPYPRPHLRRLWEETDQRYVALIGQVRTELSTEATFDPDIPYPRRITGKSDRNTSKCLGTRV